MDKHVNKSTIFPRHPSQMSETQLKRWCEARDTYLGNRMAVKRPMRIPKPPITTRVIKEQCAPIVILKEHLLDDKCVGTENNETFIVDSDVEQIDEAIQADFSTPESEKQQEIIVEQEIIEYNDKSTETDEVFNQIEQEPEAEPEQEIEIIEEFQPDPIIEIDEKKTILSSPNSSTTSLGEQFHRLKHRFKRISKERRLLSCLLCIYLFILIGLLIVIFLLLWGFADRPIVINREIVAAKSSLAPGVTQYGESCKINNDCKRPFTCNKNSLSSSSTGVCRCPLNYAFINNQCVGDLNAVCSKDTDCQRYMHCSGMNDGTRRCHCQNLYTYDDERKQCRGGYESLCENTFDCQVNMICNKTLNIAKCFCRVNYRYDSLVKKCRGEPGALCEQATGECIENAECRDGACECAFQFVPNEKKICVDPCPKISSKRMKIRYPGDCRRFIDCQQRSKHQCPQPTLFNFRTQLCDYKKNVFDCH